MPKTAEDVAAVCNWAAANGYTVRPAGIKHNWSPLAVVEGTSPSAKILIVDMTKNLTAVESVTAATGGAPAQVKVQTGCTMDNLMLALQNAPGGTGTIGYSFPHIPAPGHITVGGVLAIDAHGTAIPSPLEDLPTGYGSMSNRILAFTAVVSNAQGQYELQTFTRGQADGNDTLFLTHLGRAFLTDVTLAVVPNFYLRCQSDMSISWKKLFAAPSTPGEVPRHSMLDYLNQTGRVEAIWYPFSEYPWLKVWSYSPTQPQGSKAVTSAYNYPFSDSYPDWITPLFKCILGVPLDAAVDGAVVTDGLRKWLLSLGSSVDLRSEKGISWLRWIAEGWQILEDLIQAFKTGLGPQLTPLMGQLMQLISQIGLLVDDATDLWGPSADTMIYIKDTTLRVTANGYAISMKKENVQQAISVFANTFTSLLEKYQNQNQFPINSPLEIRITGLDDPAAIGVTGAKSPAISALNYDKEAIANGWDCALWLDVLDLPGTEHANNFYVDLEQALLSNQWFTGANGRVRPEWSKGWAYTVADGAWTDEQVIQRFQSTFSGWDDEVSGLSSFDAKNIFSNTFLASLMKPPVS
ncbi:cholesterol oxidase substrate-binding domain-containing protein [Acidobacterium capsulatum]|uniref:cholesterol oxidase substrate-binding domain-containing protein n=1 Tax=Acidobacterium capsulatum TaxID=33075 RepID=UPI00145C4B1E|nr:cholesterol oxidase substrate-binding domain-containing protein [Acidobacterium capsulatum]